MKVAVVGSGYVGLVSGACFAEMGNEVVCVDINADKIANLTKGIIPIYEPGLEALIVKNQNLGTISFSTDLENSLAKANFVFIAVGTPMGEDGSADLQYVLSVAKDIGRVMSSDLIVVDKSTVPVGTADKVNAAIQEQLDLRGSSLSFSVVSNPEFLKEGAAIRDFMQPDRVVVGADDETALAKMKELYKPFMRHHDRFISMDIRSAEMTKYAANAMLATRISFINEMANICELVGADINHVRNGIGSDSRIGYSFIYPGCGYGGSCFPKDVQALKKTAIDNGYEAQILNAVEAVNHEQKRIILKKVFSHFSTDLSNKRFAVWGLSFKPETDDMRDASSIIVINKLLESGAEVTAYDPKAQHEAESFYLKDLKNLTYAQSKYDALNGADALIILTEWKEFRSPDFLEIEQKLTQPVIFDGRNLFDKNEMKTKGFTYYQIGVKPV